MEWESMGRVRFHGSNPWRRLQAPCTEDDELKNLRWAPGAQSDNACGGFSFILVLSETMEDTEQMRQMTDSFGAIIGGCQAMRALLSASKGWVVMTVRI